MGSVDADNVDASKLCVLTTGHLDHCHDAGPDCFRQLGPGFDNRGQIGIGGPGLVGQRAGFCAALDGKYSFP